jgi:AcrR family transcriptional regulator
MICVNRRASSRRGRPRDPAIDARILSSALRLFGRTGWADFSIEKAAKSADVSKVTLYLRWRDKTSLLNDALQFAYPPWTFDEELSPEEGLIAAVEKMTLELSSESGWALHRALRDPGLPAALRDCCRTIVDDRLAAVDRFIEGLWALEAAQPQLDPPLVRKCLVGAAMGEAGDALLTGRHLDAADAREFARQAVRLILAQAIERGESQAGT